VERGGKYTLLQTPVHLAAVSDPNHCHEKLVVKDLVNDSVVAHADPIKSHASELLDSNWARIVRETFDCARDSLAV
jgi:hypothetical protein